MASKKAILCVEIAEKIRPFLAGNDPEVQGAILAELTTQWIIGHHPALRSEMLIAHYRAVVVLANKYAQSDPWRDEDAVAQAEAQAEAKRATKQ